MHSHGYDHDIGQTLGQFTPSLLLDIFCSSVNFVTQIFSPMRGTKKWKQRNASSWLFHGVPGSLPAATPPFFTKLKNPSSSSCCGAMKPDSNETSHDSKLQVISHDPCCSLFLRIQILIWIPLEGRELQALGTRLLWRLGGFVVYPHHPMERDISTIQNLTEATGNSMANEDSL